MKASGTLVARDDIEARVYLGLAAAQGDEASKAAATQLERQMTPEQIIESRTLERQYKRLLRALPRPIKPGHLGDANIDELLQAAAAGSTASLAEILARGADVEGRDIAGRTAVINAAWRGRIETVELLVQLGTDFNVADLDGMTAVQWAASNGHAKVVERLTSAGAELDLADGKGLTALMRAAWNGHIDTVRLLIAAGATTGLTDNEGNSALDYAARGGHPDIARELGGGA